MKFKNTDWPTSKLCPPEIVIVAVVEAAEYVPAVAVLASIFSITRLLYLNQISSMYAPLIDVSVNAESTSKTFSLRASGGDRFNYSNRNAAFASEKFGSALKSAFIIEEIAT